MHQRLTGVVLSAVLHLIGIPLGALALTHTHARAAALPAPRSSLTFVSMRPASAFVTPGVTAAPVQRHAPAPPSPAFTPTTIPPDEPADIRTLDTDTPTPVAPDVAESPVETALPEAPVVTAKEVRKPAAPPVRVGAFERARAPQTAVQDRAAVTSAGFTSPEAARAAAAADAAPLRVGALQNDQIDAPAEIVFKPEPRYTDEAQALGIEGTVVLEVEFSASNLVRVVRTVRGLGHGLDEAAARAAEQIRFKPARRGGIPVDCRVTVRIDFRLT
jgi:periplasmic protein TonB